MDDRDWLIRVHELVIDQHCNGAVAENFERVALLEAHHLLVILVVLARTQPQVVECCFLAPGTLLVENGVRIGIAREIEQPFENLPI